MQDGYMGLLSKQNVWWDGRIEDDVHIKQWQAHEKRWIPFQVDEISLKPFALNIVIGPRQAGKTTLIKFTIEKLLKNGAPPKNILYVRCDEIIENKQLREIIETFLAQTNGKGIFIFLDEITDIKDWEKTLKGLIDDGDLVSAVTTVSGSNAFQLQKGSELFPGRRGSGRDVLVFPLSFREFLRVADEQLFSKIEPAESIDDIQTLKGLPAIQLKLHKYLLDYFTCGGFPLAILSYLNEGKVADSAKEAYRSWVAGDILKSGKSDILSREVIKVVLTKAPSPVSWEAVAQETSIKSPPTVFSYIELFERLFILLPLFAVNPNTSTKEFAKNKKLHLQDPFLWHLFEEWSLQPIKNKNEVIAEAALAEHIARFLLKLNKGRRLNDYVSYWRNSHEIDVVAHTKKGLVGFEMKWSDRESEFKFKIGPIKNVLYISKNYLRLEKPVVIPLALFLARL